MNITKSFRPTIFLLHLRLCYLFLSFLSFFMSFIYSILVDINIIDINNTKYL